ncbi:hypothetical protein [Streptomyces sp. NPDC002533]
MDREKPHLGTVQETLLTPLYARAVENRKEQALLRDTRAEGYRLSLLRLR